MLYTPVPKSNKFTNDCSINGIFDKFHITTIGTYAISADRYDIEERQYKSGVA